MECRAGFKPNHGSGNEAELAVGRILAEFINGRPGPVHPIGGEDERRDLAPRKQGAVAGTSGVIVVDLHDLFPRDLLSKTGSSPQHPSLRSGFLPQASYSRIYSALKRTYL